MRRHWIASSTCLLLLALGAGLWWWQRCQLEHRYDPIILQAARRYQVDPALIKAVAWKESRFDSAAQGKAGELGLMQIREPAAQEWARSENLLRFSHPQIIDPATNTLAGAWYLKKLLARYLHTDNPLVYALADYNAGRRNVLRWNRGAASTNSSRFYSQITFPGTRTYIRDVLRRYRRYRHDFD